MNTIYIIHLEFSQNIQNESFPQTLRDGVQDLSRNIGLKLVSWNEIEECFLKRLYSSGKNKIGRQAIQTFMQGKSYFMKHGNALKILHSICIIVVCEKQIDQMQLNSSRRSKTLDQW